MKFFNKKNIILMITANLLLIALFVMSTYKSYQFTKLEESDLTYIKTTFDSYKTTKRMYKIICKDQSTYQITKILADDEHLEQLKPDDLIILSVVDNDVVELEVNGQKIITLDDCYKKHKNQIKFLTIFVPLFLIFINGFPGLIFFLSKKLLNITNQEKSIKLNETLYKAVYNNVLQSIYVKKGVYHCNILEQIESDLLVFTITKAIIDYINNNELVLMIDDGCKNDEMAFIFYKLGEKLYINQVFRDGIEPFEIDNQLFWYYPDNAKVTKEEQKLFEQAIKQFLLFDEELLKVVDIK